MVPDRCRLTTGIRLFWYVLMISNRGTWTTSVEHTCKPLKLPILTSVGLSFFKFNLVLHCKYFRPQLEKMEVSIVHHYAEGNEIKSCKKLRQSRHGFTFYFKWGSNSVFQIYIYIYIKI